MAPFRYLLLTCVWGSVATAMPAPAIAQYNYMPTTYYSNPTNLMLEQRSIQIGLDNARSNALPDNNNVDQIDQVSLNFNSSTTRRRSNFDSFVSKMQTDNSQDTAALKQLVTSPEFFEQIDSVMGSFGLQANNVADCFAFYWVVAWAAANNEPLNPTRNSFQSVKNQATKMLQSNTQLVSATEAQKQEISESLLLQAALIDGHIDAAEGDSTQQAALAKAARQGAKKMGLDLTTMDLTENGFVPRSGKRSDASDSAEGTNPGESGPALAANDNAGESDTGKLALYGVGGVALLAGMFALGKSFGGKG